MQKNKLPKILLIIFIIIILAVSAFMVYKYRGGSIPFDITKIGKENTKESSKDMTESIDEEEETTEEIIIKLYDEEEVEEGPIINVSLDVAKKIVLSDAELDENDVAFNETEQEDDEGYADWIISFVHDDIEYGYIVSAYDGRILKKTEKEYKE